MPDTPATAIDFDCIVVTPDEVLYEGRASKVMAPGEHGEVAVLPQHTPFYALLINGNLQVSDANHKIQEFAIDGGVMRVMTNSVTVIVGF